MRAAGLRWIPLGSGGHFHPAFTTSHGSACRTRRTCSCIRQAGYIRFVSTRGRRRARTARSQIVRSRSASDRDSCACTRAKAGAWRPAFRAKRVACAACRDARLRLGSRTSELRLCRGECRTWRDLESRPCSSSEGSKRRSAEMRAFTRIWARRFRLLVVRCRDRHHRRCARGAGWQGVRRLRGAPAPSGWRGQTNSR